VNRAPDRYHFCHLKGIFNIVSVKYLAFVLLLFTCVSAYAQKKQLYLYEEVVAEAKLELDSSMKYGELKEWATKNNVKGEFTLDITIHEKGKVLSVFAVSSDTDDLKLQNFVKDRIRLLQFNIKMPKKKAYKFQYTFNFQ
jgi:hypothetical protein